MFHRGDIRTRIMASNSKSTPIHLLYGSDEDAVKKAAAVLAKKLAPEDAMNLETIEGRADNADDAVRSIQRVREAIMTLPFFGGGKLVWWKSANFFDDHGPGKTETVKEALEGLLPDLDRVDGTSVTLLITATGVHRGKAFSKALLKMAQSRVFDQPTMRDNGEDEIIFQIEQRMKTAGLRPGAGAAERFFLATRLDTALWSSEIEKLVTFVGDDPRELTRDDVSRLIGNTREVIIWDFCHAVLAGEAKHALELLGALLGQEESEVGILILLAGQVRLAALGAALRENNMMRITRRGPASAAEISASGEAYLPRKKSGEPISTYALGQAAQRGGRRPANFWFYALQQIYAAQRNMLTGRGDKRGLLELTVLDIVANKSPSYALKDA
jgi:DNA polymerase-3 subunit delta